MKCNIFLMILNSKKHEGQVPEMELALLFQISLLLYTSIQVSQVRELIEVKEVITPYGRSGSEETILFFRKNVGHLSLNFLICESSVMNS